MALLTELLLGFGRIVSSQIKGASNAVLVNLKFLEDFGDESSGEGSSEEPLYGPLGLYGRPRPPRTTEDASGTDPEGATEVIALRLDDRAYPVSYRDLRLCKVVNPDEGELGLAHYGGGFVSLKLNADEDGTNVMIYAPRLDSSGTATAASAISIDSADGNQHICLMHEYGQSITLTKEGKIVLANKAGDAYLEVTDSGCTINGNFAVKGSVRDLSVGNPATAEGLMMSTDMLLWITQVGVAIGQIAALLNVAGPVVGAPGTVTVPTATPKASSIAKSSENAV